MSEIKLFVSKELLINLYNLGYHSGHHDTVEACYTDIFPQDMKTFHADEVIEIIEDLKDD